MLLFKDFYNLMKSTGKNYVKKVYFWPNPVNELMHAFEQSAIVNDLHSFALTALNEK